MKLKLGLIQDGGTSSPTFRHRLPQPNTHIPLDAWRQIKVTKPGLQDSPSNCDIPDVTTVVQYM